MLLFIELNILNNEEEKNWHCLLLLYRKITRLHFRTRKHSSRMRTIRCSGRRGGVCPGGVSAQGACVCVPACSEAEPPPPPPDRILDTRLWKYSVADGKNSNACIWSLVKKTTAWIQLNLAQSYCFTPPPAPHPDNGRSVIKGAFTILLLDNHRRGILQLVSLPFSMEEKRHWLRSLKMFYRQHLFLRLSWKDEASSFQQEILSVNQWSFCTEG